VGGSWLFFGHRHEKSGFFYRDEFEGFLANGTLTRLSTAWSRDGAEKIYVQDRMREAGAALFRWLADGAHFYVCGDAGRMAADVDRALRDIVADHGGMSAERADAYVDRLIETGRYQRDVY
jgi:sulfite reductase (NADPH) flavoprotein alpha-component